MALSSYTMHVYTIQTYVHLNYVWFYCVFKVNCTTSVDTDKSFGKEVCYYTYEWKLHSKFSTEKCNNMSLKNHKQTHFQAPHPLYLPNTHDKSAQKTYVSDKIIVLYYYVYSVEDTKTTDFPPKQKLKSTSYCMLCCYVMDDSQTTVYLRCDTKARLTCIKFTTHPQIVIKSI